MRKHVNALIFLVFIQGSYARNVRCTNDYDRLMTCVFTPDHRPKNCSEYSVEVEFFPNDTDHNRIYNCDISFVDVQCHCTTDVGDAGFLYGENPTVILRRNGQIKDSYIINTAEHIKPKTPTIISVNQTSDGNLNVTWLTHYKKSYSSDWKTELNYRRKQLKNDNWVSVEENAIDKTHYVFISNNLDRNTEYVVKARVYIVLNTRHFSEWSEEFTFHSGTSVESVVMKVVPVICLILVLIVCTLTCCYVKIKKTWIKNIDIFPPKIEALDNAEYMILCPEKALLSRMVVLLLKEHIGEEEKGITTLSVSGSSGNSSQTENSNSTSTSVDYGLTCHVEKDPVQNHVLERLLSAVHEDLQRERQIQSAPKMKPLVLPGLSDYESVDIHEPKNACGASSAPQSNSGCTSASSFDNQCYSVPTSPSPCNSSFFAPSLSCDLGYQSSESFDQPMSVKTDGWNVILPPLVQTEFAYQPCNGSPNSESECPPLSENMEANKTFVSQPKEQEVGKDLFETCALPLGQWSPLISDDEYRSVQSLIPS